MQRESRDWLPTDAHPTLGLRWHPLTDEFAFCVATISVATITRRSVLSLTARLFDPLGWLAPATVSAKIAVQSTWLQGVDWDTLLDDESTRFWCTFQDELPRLKAIRVPRRILADPFRDIKLYGFADASERAVVYLRQRDRMGTAHLRTILGLPWISVHCWSDSTVVLGWIKGHPSYVANRVSEIQTTIHDAHWHHVSGAQNPADCASRGLSPGTLAAHDLWWAGPSWLSKTDASWPAPAEPSTTTELPEARVTAQATTTTLIPEEPDELTRFSSHSSRLGCCEPLPGVDAGYCGGDLGGRHQISPVLPRAR
ncbi:uncharacterized protein LOC112637947 [Camponotus floridanus]|uniref:uncharacterized protein LOC112637947 n=1 Tax=Camponotus floridanus TaxID=104421 RepID=UPI000DC6A62E|nr:uncharacterized protein LOC112637947 [Camponotus floridanus]